jgi:hypothetical protein
LRLSYVSDGELLRITRTPALDIRGCLRCSPKRKQRVCGCQRLVRHGGREGTRVQTIVGTHFVQGNVQYTSVLRCNGGEESCAIRIRSSGHITGWCYFKCHRLHASSIGHICRCLSTYFARNRKVREFDFLKIVRSLGEITKHCSIWKHRAACSEAWGLTVRGISSSPRNHCPALIPHHGPPRFILHQPMHNEIMSYSRLSPGPRNQRCI